MANAIWLKNKLETHAKQAAYQSVADAKGHLQQAELRVPDRVLERIIAAWQKWWRLSLAYLRLAFRCIKEQASVP